MVSFSYAHGTCLPLVNLRSPQQMIGICIVAPSLRRISSVLYHVLSALSVLCFSRHDQTCALSHPHSAAGPLAALGANGSSGTPSPQASRTTSEQGPDYSAVQVAEDTVSHNYLGQLHSQSAQLPPSSAYVTGAASPCWRPSLHGLLWNLNLTLFSPCHLHSAAQPCP
jgi:hypothetical protein